MEMANDNFEVLSPWADVDPVIPKPLAPRVGELEGKTIGLFSNDKRAAQPLMDHLEKRLKERISGIKVTRFGNMRPNLPIIEQPDVLPRFDQWIKSVDTVAAAYGD
jgi:hypothetical protein